MDSTSAWWFRITQAEALVQARLWPVWAAVLRRIIPYHFAGSCPACQHVRGVAKDPLVVCLTGQLALQWQLGVHELLLLNSAMFRCGGALPPPEKN